MIHKEGQGILAVLFGFIFISNTALYFFGESINLPYLIFGSVLFLIVLQFFRNPTRKIAEKNNKIVYAPADGKVVVVEETEETEYFKDKRIQVSIFMSPINVHVNRNPIGGVVKYSTYHPGKYLVAWHPKASTENERTTVVIENEHSAILMRQIAGALARRIVNYLKVGAKVVQGEDMGFIKFGSRVDIFLPLDAKIKVQIDQIVDGNKTILAEL
jgi:phosphatidylserine decarboxylase